MIHSILISIIIPAYNAEKYIQQCIISLARQDLPQDNYEILVVNDGSTDSTLSILERLSKEYPNIHILTTKNQGVSAARNLGIKTAQGKTLLFVDADDYMAENVLSTIHHTMEADQLDLLVFNYCYHDKQGKILREFDWRERNNMPVEIVSGQVYIQVNALPSTVWTLAYRTSFIKKKELHFIPIRHEDEEFIPRCFYFANQVKHIITFKAKHPSYKTIKKQDSLIISKPWTVCNNLQVSTSKKYRPNKHWQNRYPPNS